MSCMLLECSSCAGTFLAHRASLSAAKQREAAFHWVAMHQALVAVV